MLMPYINLAIIISLIIISLLSFTGAIALTIKKNLLRKVLVTLTSFAAGALLAVSFFDLFPESVKISGSKAFSLVLLGLILFFVLERIIHWHHCHDEKCDVHAEHYLNLIGDGMHNLLDGGIIAAAYLVDFRAGIATTIAVAAHEIPQEIGDFSILVHGGFSEKKALLFNFISALTALFGGILTIYFSSIFSSLVPLLIAISTGGFIYIATADLLPAISKETNRKKMVLHSIAFLIGIILLSLIFYINEEETSQSDKEPKPKFSIEKSPDFISDNKISILSIFKELIWNTKLSYLS